MKKKIITIISFLLILQMVVFSAEESYLIDEANLLNEADTALINSSISQISSEYNFDIHIITLESFSGDSLIGYADEFRYDEDFDGLIFVFNTDELNREYAVSTSGEGMYIISDVELDYIDIYIVPLLISGDYYEAFDELIYLTETALEESYSDDNYYEDMYAENDYDLDPDPVYTNDIFDTYFFPFCISIVIAVVIAFTVIGSMKAKMNTARKKTHAVNYLDGDSLNLRISNDRFLYENTTRTRKSQSSSSGGGSSRSIGGSRRTNSSGRSRGGRSRRF